VNEHHQLPLPVLEAQSHVQDADSGTPEICNRISDAPGVLETLRHLRPLQLVFAAFFVQLVLIVVISLVKQESPVYIARGPFFGWDYHAFHISADYWLHGFSPYLNVKLYTPPSSLFPALLLHGFGFATARYWFFAFNVGAILISLFTFARSLGLSRAAAVQLLAITLMYYPFYTVIERGNMDGLMLAALLLAFQSRRRLVRAALYAFSVGLKLYTGLLIFLLARKKCFTTAATVLAFLILFQLPFLNFESDWLPAVLRRTGLMRLNENFSPAALLWYAGVPMWKTLFLFGWSGSLLFALARDRDPDERWAVLTYIPWMVSFPTFVLAHSGIMYVPLLAMLAKQADARSLTSRDWLLVAGFLLTGVQEVAFATFAGGCHLLWEISYLTAPAGSLLIVLSVCVGTLRREPVKLP
jgi:hypothetical protein